MKYQAIWISVFLIGCISFGFIANRELMLYRYRGITQEVLAYKEAEKTSYTEALERYKKAKKLFEYFLQRYEVKDQSIVLKESKSLFSNVRFADFQKIEPILTINARAENDLFSCAWLVAKNKYPHNDSADIDRDHGINDQMITEILGFDSQKQNYSATQLTILDHQIPMISKISNMAMMLANAGRFDQARDMLLLLEEDNIDKVFRISLLALAAIKANHKEEAIKLLDYDVEFANSLVMDSADGFDGLYYISEAYRLLGLSKQYFQTLESIFQYVETGEEYNSEYSKIVLLIADHLLELGNKDLSIRALKLALTHITISTEVEPLRYRISFDDLAKIMIKLDSLNQSALAKQGFGYFKDKYEQALLHLALADQYFKEQPKKAVDSIEKAKGLIKDIELTTDQIDISIKIVQSYANKHMKKETLIMIEDILRYIEKNIYSSDDRSYKYLDAVDILLSYKMVNEALVVAKKIQIEEDRSSALYSIASCYIKNNQIYKAEQLVKDIGWGHRVDFNSLTYQEIALKYYENNSMDTALFYIKKANVDHQSYFYIQLTKDAIKSKNIAKAKIYLLKAYEMYKKITYSNSETSICSLLIGLSDELVEENLISKILSSEKQGFDKDYFLAEFANKYSQQNNVEKFKYFYQQITTDYQKKTVLLKASAPDAPEKIKNIAYSEAVKTNNKEIISIHRYEEAIKLIEKKEYEKAFHLIEKLEFEFDKATILTLLATHWEKPNLSGANGQILHKIIESCNQQTNE